MPSNLVLETSAMTYLISAFWKAMASQLFDCATL